MHNVGSMFRTADAMGIEKLYLCGITSTPTDRFGVIRAQIQKTALGAETSVAWESHVRTHALIDRLKKAGWYIVALEQDARSRPYTDLPRRLPARTALVVGNEIKGLSKSILDRSDFVLELPMKGAKESLNVSVSFGIGTHILAQRL